MTQSKPATLILRTQVLIGAEEGHSLVTSRNPPGYMMGEKKGGKAGEKQRESKREAEGELSKKNIPEGKENSKENSILLER